MSLFLPIGRRISGGAISFKHQIVLLVCTSVLVSSALIGGLFYFYIEDIVLRMSIEELPRETRRVAQRVEAGFDALTADVQQLAKSSGTAGIAGVSRPGSAAFNPEKARELRDQLANDFISLMVTRQHYKQVSLTGVTENGREVVRVTNTGAGIIRQAEASLLRRAGDAFFAEALKAGGRTHFSELSYSRENGTLDGELLLTLRAAARVSDRQGLLFGIIIIDVDFGEMLGSFVSELEPDIDSRLFLVTGNGDYLEYSTQDGISLFGVRDDLSTVLPPALSAIVSSDKAEELIVTDGMAAFSTRQYYGPPNADTYVTVAQVTPLEAFLVPAHDMRNVGLAFVSVMVVVCVFAGMFLARRITLPLQRMTRVIAGSGGSVAVGDLPVGRRDEIGELARAFVKKTNALTESDARAAAVIDNMVDGVVTIDEFGTIDSFNPACETIFGFSRDEAIGHGVSMLIPEAAGGKHSRHLQRYLRGGERHISGVRRELQGRRKDGTVFPIELAVGEVEFGKRRLFSGIIRDISERKLMEIIKDEFVSTVNHEMRTPLTSIIGALGLLRGKFMESLDARARRLVSLSYRNAERLNRLVNDILDIEKIAAGKMDYRMEPLEIAGLVEEVVDGQRLYAEEKGVDLNFQHGVSGVMVLVDSDRFTQALVNLISNAIKYSGWSDVVVIRAALTGRHEIAVSIKDDGPGIPEEFRTRIFGKFAQADSSSARTRGGSGLGLNITKTIVEAFDGRVDYSSVEGEGSEFTLYLPVWRREKVRA